MKLAATKQDGTCFVVNFTKYIQARCSNYFNVTVKISKITLCYSIFTQEILINYITKIMLPMSVLNLTEDSYFIEHELILTFKH